MDASFKTVIRQFGISKGSPQERPRNIVVAEGPEARHSRGRLYILVETLGGLPDPGYALGRLTAIIREEYHRATGSTTGSMGAALRAANDWLFEENLNSPREQRGVAGVTCAVLRDGELYIGQVGPALAYLAQADGLRRFPEDSPWLRQAVPSDAERAALPPLGVRRVIEPQFYHAAVEVGDTFALASPALARLSADEAIANALEQDPDLASRQLQMLVDGHDLNLLLVRLAGEESALPWADDEAPAALETEELAEPGLPRPVLRQMQLGAAWRAVQGPLSRVGQGLLALLRNMLPDRAPGTRAAPRPTAVPRRASGARALTLLAILIPVLAVCIVFITRYQYEHSRRTRVADLLRQATEARATVLNSGQREAQRVALRQAIGFIDQALQLSPDEAAALELRRQVVDELDAASVVQRLYTIWPLADLGTEAANLAEPARVIVQGADIFVLDRATDRAYHRLLNPAGDALEVPAPNAVLSQKGEQRGAITVGELVDMAWLPAGGERATANLAILERNGSLLEYDASRGVSVLPVADSAAWKKPQAAGGFNGNFYLLDAQQSRILKYVATTGGYTNPPVDYLSAGAKVDLSGAVDMAIDGNIYVLLADGTILKFLAGEQQSYQIVDLDEPLKNPVALYVSGQDDAHGYVYVADAGLARVVQLTKQGEFIRQFRVAEGQAPLSQLRGLFVDEAQQRIYLVNGSRLYAAPLSQSAVPAPEPSETPAGGS